MQNMNHLSREILYKIVAPIKIVITDVVFLGDITHSFDALQPDSEC